MPGGCGRRPPLRRSWHETLAFGLVRPDGSLKAPCRRDPALRRYFAARPARHNAGVDLDISPETTTGTPLAHARRPVRGFHGPGRLPPILARRLYAQGGPVEGVEPFQPHLTWLAIPYSWIRDKETRAGLANHADESSSRMPLRPERRYRRRRRTIRRQDRQLRSIVGRHFPSTRAPDHLRADLRRKLSKLKGQSRAASAPPNRLLAYHRVDRGGRRAGGVIRSAQRWRKSALVAARRLTPLPKCRLSLSPPGPPSQA